MSSLRLRILLSLVATTFLLAVLLGSWHFRHVRHLVTRNFAGTSRLFASQIARQAVPALFTENADQLAVLASQSLAIPSLQSIAFLNQSGETILRSEASTRPTGVGSGSSAPGLLQQGEDFQIQEPVVLTSFTSDNMPAGPPRLIGKVILSFTLRDLNLELNSIRNTVIFAETVFALIAGLLMLSLERWVTRPLVDLIAKIQAIARGDLSIRVDIPARAGEITTLCDSVNQMADALQQRRVAMERTLSERTAAVQKLRSLMQNMSNGVIVNEVIGDGADFVIQELNHAAEAIMAIRRDDALGRRAAEVLPGIEDMGLLAMFQRVFRTGISEHCPEAFYEDSHVQGWREIFVYRLPSGEVVAVFNDISDRKRIEESWRQFNAELDQRVRDRTAQLEVANHELEAFSYSVSHDLRAPLRGIDGWSVALLEDCGEQLDEAGRQYLDRVRAEAQRMGVLIDALLQLSRVTRSKLEPTAVDLTALAQAVCVRLQEAYAGRTLEFIIPPGLQTRGDPLLLEVVLTNLLGNACKFTAPRPRARIELGKENAAFFVRDNGVGFDMAFAAKLFGAFQRLHRTSEFPGTGIGLATVARIIHRHGGQVWADSRPDAGATFYFTIGEGT